MMSSGALVAVVVFQLLVGFIAVILAAFCAACFGAEFGYAVVWWSVSFPQHSLSLRYLNTMFVNEMIARTVRLDSRHSMSPMAQSGI